MRYEKLRFRALSLVLLFGIVLALTGQAYARHYLSEANVEESNCTPVQDRTTVFAEVWGYVSPAGNAPVGSVVTAHRPDGTQVGCFVVSTADAYGLMRIYGEDSNTPGAPGLQDGDQVSFEIDGSLIRGAESKDNPQWDMTWDASRDDKAVCHVDLSPYSVYDMDYDCDVDIVDIMLVAGHWNCYEGDACYSPSYDLDGDGDVDIVDIMRVAAHWNCTCDDDCYWE